VSDSSDASGAVDKHTVLVEILDGHGRVNLRERVVLGEDRRVFTIGRAVDADVTLDDPHAAPVHARVEVTADGKVLVSDLASVNGLVIAGKRQRGAEHAEVPDGLLQVGRTRLRIRTAHEQLAPEKPDNLRPASILHDPAWLAGIGAVAGFAQLAYNTWLGAPRDLITILVTTLISAIAAAGIWVAFWALLSRMLRGEWRWLRHAAIFLGVAAIFYAVNGLLELGWFVFSLPQWSTDRRHRAGLCTLFASDPCLEHHRAPCRDDRVHRAGTVGRRRAVGAGAAATARRQSHRREPARVSALAAADIRRYGGQLLPARRGPA
jgi:Inner membrane component of T3SS, cytoplasmic domain